MGTTVLEEIAQQAVARFVEAIDADPDAEAFPELLTAEEQVVQWAQTTGQRMMQALVDARLRQAKTGQVRCPDCGEPMEWLRTTTWVRCTQVGPIQVKDAYAYCRDCHCSVRPLHSLLGTDREKWSLSVQEAAVDLASDESCQKAVDKLERQRGIEMGRTTALRQLHEHGKRARAFIDQKLQRALDEAGQEARRSGGAVELEVEYDGGMVPTAVLEPIKVEPGQEVELTLVRKLPKRRKRTFWQEVKAGLVQAPGETKRLYTVRPTGELDPVFDDLFALAVLKHWTEQTHVRGISDGARYIRGRLAEIFHACPFRFILDRPHAREHLSEAGEALKELRGVDVQAWAEQAMTSLEAGEAMVVVEELRNAYQDSGGKPNGDDRLRLNADYFERNRDAVAYAEYRARGWSQASSEIESAHGHIVQVRLKIPGAWWHPDNVPNILALRMLKANGWWEEYWADQRRQWRQRARRFAERIQQPIVAERAAA